MSGNFFPHIPVGGKSPLYSGENSLAAKAFFTVNSQNPRRDCGTYSELQTILWTKSEPQTFLQKQSEHLTCLWDIFRTPDVSADTVRTPDASVDIVRTPVIPVNTEHFCGLLYSQDLWRFCEVQNSQDSTRFCGIKSGLHTFCGL